MSTHSVNGGDQAALCLPDTPSISPSSPLLSGGGLQDVVSSSRPLLASRPNDSAEAQHTTPHSRLRSVDDVCDFSFLNLEFSPPSSAMVAVVATRVLVGPPTADGDADDRVCWFPDLDLGFEMSPAAIALPTTRQRHDAPPSTFAATTRSLAFVSGELKEAMLAASHRRGYVRVRSPERSVGAKVNALGIGDEFELETRREIEGLWRASALMNGRVAALEAKPRQAAISMQQGHVMPVRLAVRPEWVTFPLNPACASECEPRPDVIRLIEAVLPSFSPRTDPLAWQKVAELVQAVGKTAEQCAAMGWDDLFAEFDKPRRKIRGPSPCERLAKLWGTEDGKVFLRTAKDIETIAKRIGKGLTVTKQSAFFKSVIAPAREAYKSLVKYEADAARLRAARARERINARGEGLKPNRP